MAATRMVFCHTFTAARLPAPRLRALHALALSTFLRLLPARRHASYHYRARQTATLAFHLPLPGYTLLYYPTG